MKNVSPEHRLIRSSGKLGDLILSLCAVNALGGGRMLLRCDHDMQFGKSSIQSIRPLLEVLSFITGVSDWNGETCEVNLDAFRNIASPNVNILHSILFSLGLPDSVAQVAWIPCELPFEGPVVSVLFARSLNRFELPGFWEEAYRIFAGQAVFVGLPEEHAAFSARFGPIPFRRTNDLLELAGFIGACDLFIGNQSAPFAIAEAQKKSAILEVDPQCPNCIFHRSNLLNIQTPEDLWMIEAAEDLLGLLGKRKCNWWITTNLELDAQLAKARATGQALERLIQRIRARKSFSAIAANPSHWSRLTASIQSQPVPLLDPSAVLMPPAELQSMLLSQGYRITSATAVATDPSLFASKLSESLCDPALGESLNLLEVYFEAEPVPPIVEERTAGKLGPAKIPGVSVIILTYNSASSIEGCLQSVMGSLSEADELIVVDNASQDQTLPFAQNAISGSPNASLIKNETNLGYSVGANVGLRASRGRYVLLLNPDTVLLPGWREKLVDRFEDDFVAAVGPMTNCVSGTQFAGYHLNERERVGLSGLEIERNLKARYAGRSEVVKLLIGFCVMFRRSALERVGLLDEDLFLGSDDLEICWRLRTHGYRLVVAKDIFVIHQGSGSFQSMPKAETEAHLRLSSEVLAGKIRKVYAPGPTPTSEELFDNPIFGHMLG